MAIIVGNPVGIPNPITDLAQTDPTKADYVKNKKLSYMEDDVGYAKEDDLDSQKYYGDANIKPSDISLFTFRVDDETITASVAAKTRGSDGISGDIVIPYEYEKDGKVYKVTNIDSFDNCFKITSIIIPNSVTEISSGAFQYCSFKSIVLPNSIKAISEGLFAFSGIRSVTIPKVVTSIGNYAFDDCLMLTHVYYEGSKEQWDEIVIGDYNERLQNANIYYKYMGSPDTEMSDTSENAVQNKVIKEYVDEEAKNVADYATNISSSVDNRLTDEMFLMEERINGKLVLKADKEAHHEYRGDVWDYAEYDFYNENNVESRFKILQRLSILISSGEYFLGYTSGLSFDSGETPTAIDYIGSGALNWVGTDCTTVDGYSIFQPSANTHYDIVFYFNGTQFIGLVNGFVPASGNVVSE